MRQLEEVIVDVDKTHQRLGNAVALSAICVKARICLLLVAPSGCGKSVITNIIAGAHPNPVPILSITKARLGSFKDTFNNFRGVVLMDDIAAAGSTYERKETIVAFSTLCYSHTISKHTWTADYEISDFHGGAILNIQPAILAEIYEYPEWESLIQDRTLRYYHLYRAVIPNNTQPNLKIDWGIDLDLVHKPRHDYKLYHSLQEVCAIQWGDSRVNEHLDMLLKSVAALDRRQDVTNADLQFLYKLLKPMTIERSIMDKQGFETDRYMDNDLCAVLVEFASWENINIERIARDYKVSPSTAYRILQRIHRWFKEDSTMSKMLIPKAELKQILKEAGVKR